MQEHNDCRQDDGYKCLDPRTAWNAEVLDLPFSEVCGFPPKGNNPLPELDEDDEGGERSNDVCTGRSRPVPAAPRRRGRGAAGMTGAGD